MDAVSAQWVKSHSGRRWSAAVPIPKPWTRKSTRRAEMTAAPVEAQLGAALRLFRTRKPTITSPDVASQIGYASLDCAASRPSIFNLLIGNLQILNVDFLGGA